MTTSHVLGQGLLTWPAAERHSDRYGTVCLTRDEAPRSPYEPVHFVDLDHSVDGLRGTLVAEVLQTRTSRHIGDLSRGLMPQPATVGERVVLGSGTVFLARTTYGADLVGVMPGDGRATDWLDPQALYRLHDQTVRLYLVPDRQPPPEATTPDPT